MKVAVTGATGFIGRPLISYLQAIGHECVALSRNPERAKLPSRIAIVPPDALPPCDAIVNLAGETVVGLWTPAKRRAILRSRVEGTRRLIAQARGLAKPPRLFLSASAIGYYGHRPGELLDEDAGPDPQKRFRAQVCEAWEEEAHRARELGASVTTLRLGNVMDREGGFLGGLLPLYRCGATFVLGRPDAALSWISREDAVRLIAFALECETLSGPVNVVAPAPISQRILATTLAHRLGREVRGTIPPWMLRCALGEFSSALLDDQRVAPTRAISAGFHFFHPAWRSCMDAAFGDPDPARERK